MTHHPIITGILLAAAVFLALVGAIGVASMRDPFQRLHFSIPAASLGMWLIAIAVWIESSDPQARIKIILISIILPILNSVLTHETARAVRIRRKGDWRPGPEEHIPTVGEEDTTARGKR